MLVDLVRRSVGDALRQAGANRFEATSEHCPACRTGGSSANGLSVFRGDDGNWRWKCFACGEGGTAIDWMMAVSGDRSVVEAAKAALGAEALPQFQSFTPVATDDGAAPEDVAESEKTQALIRCINTIRAKAGPGEPEVLSYFAGRGISAKAAGLLAATGVLRTLPADPYRAHRFLCEILADEQHSGEAWLLKAGLLKEGKKFTALAYRPMLFLGTTWLEARIIHAPAEKEPKAIRYGTQASPLSFRKDKGATSLITVVEGPIDLLSKIEMGVEPGQVVVCIPGVSSWKPEWLTAGVRSYSDALWELALDNDEPGHTCAEKMARVLDGVGGRWKRSVPFAGKDINDELMSMRRAA